MLIYRILSRLLDYPDQTLRVHLPELADLVQAGNGLNPQESETIQAFIAWMQEAEPYALESDYVQTFDLVPAHSLHLTHHIFGDEDRERGPALVDIAEHYKGNGLEAIDGELPDYLPMLLEYASTLDSMAARVFLGDAAKVVGRVADSLEQAGSPYAPIVRLIARRGHLASQAA